jgi:predicted CopG family antitoxin
MARASEVRVPCAEETRERLWAAKQGREPYDDVLRRLLDRYEEDMTDHSTPTAKSDT